MQSVLGRLLCRARAALSLLALLLVAPESGSVEPAAKDPQHPPLPPVLPVDAIGSMSVGSPETGYLFNAVQMPESESEWLLFDSEHAHGTEETIRALMQAVRRVRQQFPDSPPAVIGSISHRFGGPYPPHRSHRTGRDADVHFFLIDRNPHGWYEPAKKENLDRPRSWTLLKAVLSDALVDFVLFDREVQQWLIQYALSSGEDPDWVHQLFHGCGRAPPLIQHAPGHRGHMHVRFASPVARERGRREYHNLVRQGHLELPVREVEHVVSASDTLLGLANRYRTSIALIQQLNGIDASGIRPNQKLTILERLPIAGAQAPVEIRSVPSPGSKCSDGAF